ncbi:helix-turn-helix domain-containing protein [Vibrio splendidus]|uniref:helix-turn-helix domain-containing protein n=1 Tax=Vibrio splendidus TaxID=29497 RepID=UPI00148C61EE|nr:helix-turn-helix domain-containing protein [Vibrio splendidus]NOI91227.1 helix-turn-helix domain-containing protein [Vibrio splendidus]
MCVSLILSFIPLKTGSPISKLVLLKLADNADARGVCFPSLNYLAQYCEVSVRTVKRHVNELEKQGFVKRIKRFDDSGRQRSNIYQLRLPIGNHIQQTDLDQAARVLDQEDGDLVQENSVLERNEQAGPAQVDREQTESKQASLDEAGFDEIALDEKAFDEITFEKIGINKTDQHKSNFNTNSPNLPISDHLDTHLGDLRSDTESDRPAHIIFHKEHKTELNLKNGILGDVDVLDTPNSSEEPDTAISTPKSKTKNEAVIDLLTKEGCAPIYHEFYEILKRTYPKLDVLQELHAMQAWLYINPDKRKSFEHIGHFVNGWLRRSAQAKAKRGSSPVFKQAKTGKPARASTPTKVAQLQKNTQAIDSAKVIQAAKPMEPKHPTPVSQALADYKAKSSTNPFEARIKALVQSKSPGTDSKP